MKEHTRIRGDEELPIKEAEGQEDFLCAPRRSKGSEDKSGCRCSGTSAIFSLCVNIDRPSRRYGGRNGRCGILPGTTLCAYAYSPADVEERHERCCWRCPVRFHINGEANVSHTPMGSVARGGNGKTEEEGRWCCGISGLANLDANTSYPIGGGGDGVREKCQTDGVRWVRDSRDGWTQLSGHDVRSRSPHNQGTSSVGRCTEGKGSRHESQRFMPHDGHTYLLGHIAPCMLTCLWPPSWHGGATGDVTKPRHQPSSPRWGQSLRTAPAPSAEPPLEDQQPGGDDLCRSAHPFPRPTAPAWDTTWTHTNGSHSTNKTQGGSRDGWDQGEGREFCGWFDGGGLGGIAPRRRAGGPPLAESGAAAAGLDLRLRDACAAVGLYLLLVVIPFFAFVDDGEGDPGPMHIYQLGNGGPRRARFLRGRRPSTATRRGCGPAGARLAPRPRVKIIPPCNVIAGRRVPWRSGRRGFRGKRRVNSSMRRECWNIVRYGQGRPLGGGSGDMQRRGPGGPDETASPLLYDFAEADAVPQPIGDLPTTRARPMQRRSVRTPRKCSWIMRTFMALAMCASARATGGQPATDAAIPIAHRTHLMSVQAAAGDSGTVHDVVAWVARPDMPTAIQHPRPDQTGFHGAFAAGHDNQLGPPTGDQFNLRAVSINSTGWGALKEFLAMTDAHLVCGQEHRLPACAIPAASAWARRHGWKSVWAPATKGPKGGWSAGTVILARACMGLRHPDVGGRIVEDARVVAAVVEAPGFRPFMTYSTYLHHGQGPSRANLSICASIGEHYERQGDPALQFLIAADWNLEPQTLAGTGLADTMQAKIVHPLGARGTCRTRTRAATYDYFVMSRPMAAVVDSVSALEATGVRTHTPVLLSFLPRPTSLRSLALRQPPPIPTERVYGPIPAPPPEWGPLLTTANGLCDAVRAGAQEGAADHALSELYALWADLAEQELIDINGAPVAKEGMRGKGPRFVWKSILPERRGTGYGGSRAAAWAWLDDLLRDLSRVTAKTDPQDERLGLVAQLRVAAQADRPRNFAAAVPLSTITDIERLIDDALDLIAADAETLPTTTDDARGDHVDGDGDSLRRDLPGDQGQLQEEQDETSVWYEWRRTLD